MANKRMFSIDVVDTDKFLEGRDLFHFRFSFIFSFWNESR